jgi:hypothetical protein
MLLFTTEDLTSPSSINTFKKKSILFEKRPVLLVILTKGRIAGDQLNAKSRSAKIFVFRKPWSNQVSLDKRGAPFGRQ